MSFRINHASVISQANTIADLANDLQTQINRLNVTEQNLRAGWCGRAADVFFSRIAEQRTTLNTQRQHMEMLATTIRDTANSIQRADEDAARHAAFG